MKKIIAVLTLLLLTPTRAAHAQQVVSLCTTISGQQVASCQPVSAANPLPITLGTSGLPGVTSINSVGGAFTFTGSGVSCTSTTCTFSGGGGGVTTFSGGTTGLLPSSATSGAVTLSGSLSPSNGGTGCSGVQVISSGTTGTLSGNPCTVLWTSTTVGTKTQPTPVCSSSNAGQDFTVIDEASNFDVNGICNVTPTTGTTLNQIGGFTMNSTSQANTFECDGSTNWVIKSQYRVQ